MQHVNKANLIPRGLRDLAGAKCALRRGIEFDLMSLYRSHGYEEIMTPTLEYYDLFTACDNTIALESAYKLVDSDGSILVLRPDMTVPASRLVSTRLQGARMPLRLFYNSNVYRREQPQGGLRAEFVQSGAELVGAGGMRADAEIILLAAKALKRADAGDFKIEIGHAGIFRSLASFLMLGDDEYEIMRMNIEKKNYAALTAQLETLGDDNAGAARVIARLPRMFGGREILKKAQGMIKDEASCAILDYLDKLMGICESAGFGDCITIDLGLVQHMDYYTGIVFQGYIDGAGSPVLSGGRYDHLYDRFGAFSPRGGTAAETASVPAAGFAVMVDSLADAAEKKCGGAAETPGVAIHYADGFAGDAERLAAQLVSKDGICVTSTFDALEDTVLWAREAEIGKVIVIDENGQREVSL